jgi:hypothetical protein
VERADSGAYVCSASNAAGEVQRLVTLHVYEAPTLRAGAPLEYVLLEGDVAAVRFFL